MQALRSTNRGLVWITVWAVLAARRLGSKSLSIWCQHCRHNRNRSSFLHPLSLGYTASSLPVMCQGKATVATKDADITLTSNMDGELIRPAHVIIANFHACKSLCYWLHAWLCTSKPSPQSLTLHWV
ncbi:hypothetical protein BDD12DRAFT_159668 [Trichophaea hybrida]|nr:hypothetical protein BDD12DRAFT_159668 [Trichophaea hybrida]